jgi:hypothetical protein
MKDASTAENQAGCTRRYYVNSNGVLWRCDNAIRAKGFGNGRTMTVQMETLKDRQRVQRDLR